MTVRISWEETNIAEDGHLVYRSESTMDPNSLPSPLVILGADITQYDDTTAVSGTTYFYRVSAVKGLEERVSDEISISTSDGVPADYVAAWYAADASGTSQPDRSTNDNDGTATGPTLTGGVWVFDGDGDRIAFGDILDSVITGADAQFAISVRCTPSGGTGAETLIGKIGGGDHGENQRSWAFLLINGNPYLTTYSSVNAAGYRDYLSDTDVMGNGEVEVTVSYDGTIDTNNGLDRVKFFADGIETGVSLAASAGGLSQIVNSTAQVSIGALVGTANTTVTNEYSGSIKRIVVYARPVSAADASALTSEAI